MTDEERVGEVLNGKTRIWRFTAEEQSGSSDIADRLLWPGILRAEHELAVSLFGGLCEGTGEPSRGTPSPYRFLITLNDPDGPHTPVTRFGTRREDMPGQIFE